MAEASDMSDAAGSLGYAVLRRDELANSAFCGKKTHGTGA
jgi:hypothetical protein